MAKAIQKTNPFSSLFTDPLVADAFRRAERDTPPAALAVEPPRQPSLVDGAAERVMEMA